MSLLRKQSRQLVANIKEEDILEDVPSLKTVNLVRGCTDSAGGCYTLAGGCQCIADITGLGTTFIGLHVISGGDITARNRYHHLSSPDWRG